MFREAAKGLLLASAVASMFAGPAASAKSAKHHVKLIKCAGINACKGKGSCAGADNACKSKNACKGKGWVETTARHCKAKHGKIIAMNMKKK